MDALEDTFSGGGTNVNYNMQTPTAMTMQVIEAYHLRPIYNNIRKVFSLVADCMYDAMIKKQKLKLGFTPQVKSEDVKIKSTRRKKGSKIK